MGSIKGTRYVVIRKMVRERGSVFEEQFFAKLTPLEKDRYEKATPVSQIRLEEIPDQGNVVTVAGELFFPGDADGIQKVAAVIAQENLDGIYKFLLQIPSVEYAIQRGAKIWQAYNDTGDPVVQKVTPNSLEFVVRHYPDMPALHRKYIQGFLKGMIQMTRAKKSFVALDESDSENWTWKITWEG